MSVLFYSPDLSLTRPKESKMAAVEETEDLEMTNTKPRCNKRRSFVDHLHEVDKFVKSLSGMCTLLWCDPFCDPFVTLL